jgi:hypothetical protein
MLEANDDIVGIPDHDHVARCFVPSPALGPKIEDVMEVDGSRAVAKSPSPVPSPFPQSSRSRLRGCRSATISGRAG